MKHKPDDTAILEDISGICRTTRCCGNRRRAVLRGFYNSILEITCNTCNNKVTIRPDQKLSDGDLLFLPDDPAWLDPGRHRPFTDDVDPGDTSTGRYVHGRR